MTSSMVLFFKALVFLRVVWQFRIPHLLVRKILPLIVSGKPNVSQSVRFLMPKVTYTWIHSLK